MQKIVILILTLLILLVSNTDTLAKVKMLDVVHLTDGNYDAETALDLLPLPRLNSCCHGCDGDYYPHRRH